MSSSTSAPTAARSPGKLIFFAVFLLLTFFVTYMKNAQVSDPASPVAQHFAPAKSFLIVHAIFGGIAIVLGAFQFSNRLRARYLKAHRMLGYVYVASVFISAPFAVPVALKLGTPSLVAASAVQSFGWMVTTAIALYAVRHGNIAAHRRWMIRSYPFAMVFTVARLIIPIPPILSHGDKGIEIVVWCTVAMAAFLPSIFLDWGGPLSRRPAPAAVGS
jgi:uncharacterized membrane protein